MGILWAKSGLVERDLSDERAAGAIAYFFVGGTTTPLVTFDDAAETIPHPLDLETDANGRWPAVFIPYSDDGYDVQVITSEGTQLYYHQSVPNPRPIDPKDPDTGETIGAANLIKTGHVHWEPIDETKDGYVRLNGRSIGNASSGATERANEDTLALFSYYWAKTTQAVAPVSGSGRTSTAAADFAANKIVHLPDMRAGLARGLDTMGNTASGRLASAPLNQHPVSGAFGTTIMPGSSIGANTHTLTTAQIPSHLHAVSLVTSSDSHTHAVALTTGAAGAHTHIATVTDPGHIHLSSAGSYVVSSGGGVYAAGASGGLMTNVPSNTTGITVANAAAADHTHSVSGDTGSYAHTHTVNGNTDLTGGGGAHNIVDFSVLGSFYQKL